MNNNPIGIFDSGVGGLSVLLEIRKLMPEETLIFVADQAYVPYGGKTKNELIDRATRIMEFFVQKKVKAVVMACNTATVYTIEEMRQKFTVPIIGTVPVVKTIANLTKSGKTAIFSTPATAKSPYLDALIAKFAKDINVIKIGGSNLEALVEEGNLDNPQINKVLNEVLGPLINEGVDAMALGCTHYPFLRDKIQKVVGKGVGIVDSGGAVARRLNQVLENESLLSLHKGEDWYYTTGDRVKFKSVAEQLMKQEIKNVSHVDL